MILTEQDRRSFLLRSLALAGSALLAGHAASIVPASRRLFRSGRLARNPVAATFEAFHPRAPLPTTPLWTPAGPRRFSDLKNKVTLVSLWAEFCVPCLQEAHDLGELRRRHIRQGFDVLAVNLDDAQNPARARRRLDQVDAATLPCWVEQGGGTIGPLLATPHGGHGFTLPCNLLMNARGQIVGRAFGTHLIKDDPVPTGAQGGAAGGAPGKADATWWSTPAADEFAALLAKSALDQL
ncbi:TlpA family protein disulfide reductase [Sphingomonas sp.]|uniref:TlpA family protein disulfide reductase n=1 Tax=Sphingomonas sp. TaxID=28214 RepID=UPI003B3A8388